MDRLPSGDTISVSGKDWDVPPAMTWDAMKYKDQTLDSAIVQGLYASAYEQPSPIQQRAIIPIMSGRDVIAQAQTGTGKTGAFVTGILHRLELDIPSTQAIIVAPTHELARQNCAVLRDLGRKTSLITRVCVGGVPRAEDMDAIRNQNVHVICGTPGRIADLLGHNGRRRDRESTERSRNVVRGAPIKILVLDEADTLLSEGFQDAVRGIFSMVSKDTQVVLVSATMPKSVLDLTNSFMRDPISILVEPKKLTLEGIKQEYIKVVDHSDTDVNIDEHRIACLKALLATTDIVQALIFCSHKDRAEDVHKELEAAGHNVGYLISELKELRELAMNRFRDGRTRILVATDIASRGIDVVGVSLVVNFDRPGTAETYLQRIGRAARFGRQGHGVTLILDSSDDAVFIKNVEEHYGCKIDPLDIDWSGHMTVHGDDA